MTLHAQMKEFFACGSSAPVRVESEGGTAVWLAGTLVAGTWTASAARVMALLELFFEPLIDADQKASLASLSL